MKNKVILPIIILGLVILTLGFVSQTAFGSSFLSIDKVSVDRSSQIRVYGVTNGAEMLTIDWSPNDLNNKLNTRDSKVTKGVTGTIELRDPKKEFTLTKDLSKPFLQYKSAQISLFRSCSNNIPNGYKYAGSVGTSFTKRNCLYYKSIGSYGSFTGSTTEKTPVYIKIGSATGILRPSSGSNSIILNDGKTRVEWVGNLVNTRGLEKPSYGIFYQNSNYRFLIDQDAFTRSRISMNRMAQEIGVSKIELGGIVGSLLNIRKYSSIDQAVKDHNTRLSEILNSKTNIYKNSVSVNNVNFVGNKMVVDLNTATTFPTFIITLKADTVGLVQLKGSPKIQSCVSNVNLNSGSLTSPKVTVKNIGDSAGSFYGKVTCDKTTVSGTFNEQLVNKGQTIDIPIQISGIAEVRDISSSCKLTVTDRKSFDSDTCRFNVDVKYQPNAICEPSTVSCFGSSVLRTCNSEGTAYTDVSCDNGCEVKSGADECIGVKPVSNDLTVARNACELKDSNQPYLGWTFSSTVKEPSTFTKIITLGFTKTKSTYECKASFVKYYIYLFIILIGFYFIRFYDFTNKRFKFK